VKHEKQRHCQSRDTVKTFAPGLGRPGLVGGALGALLLPLPAAGAWPFLIGSGNLALVAAPRETSVLFAGLIAVLFFGERLTRVRAAVLAVAVAGIVIMKAG